jgi:hypothetical protein
MDGEALGYSGGKVGTLGLNEEQEGGGQAVGRRQEAGGSRRAAVD